PEQDNYYSLLLRRSITLLLLRTTGAPVLRSILLLTTITGAPLLWSKILLNRTTIIP
ncbi:unnamed protein product, partial [Amoebophrya sp. A25]